MIFFVGMLAITVYEIKHEPSSTKDIYALILTISKQILYSAGLVATILYFIRWQNKWFEQHAQTEFQLKQFELDMERASWIVETSLEWKDAKGTSIPSELLNSLSNNLFRDSKEKNEAVMHPADQLASAIFGTSSMARIKIGDSELQIDPKKLAKEKPIES